MDYDDNDFQSQNFQLAGEDNNKFTSSLQPFPLPKFDIDEQLQVHLRFDNIIESEVYFGVQGQDSNWIEGLSTGSSVVEFSSGATESCSISRTNNVWSEATSSESVEMLLKSVGENQMIDHKDGDANDQLSAMDSPIDTLFIKGNNGGCQTGNIEGKDEGDDQCLSSLTRSTEDATRRQSQVVSISPGPMLGKAVEVLGSQLSNEKLISQVNPAVERSISDKNVPSASNDSFQLVRDDSPLDNKVGKSKVDDYMSLRPQDRLPSPDSIMHENKDAERLAMSTGNTNIDPGSSNSQLLSQQIVELQNVYGEIHAPEGQEVEYDALKLKTSCTVESAVNSVKLLSEGSNEPLLSESSDGLLEAITCSVKRLQKDSDCCNEAGILTKEAAPSVMEGSAKVLKPSEERSNEHAIEVSDVVGQFKDIGYCQMDFSASNKAHSGIPLAVKNSDLINSGEEKELAYVKEVPLETANLVDSDRNVGVVDSSKLGAFEQCQDFTDPLKNGAEGRKDEDERMIASTAFTCQNTEQAGKSTVAEDAKADFNSSTGGSENPSIDSSTALPQKHCSDVPHVHEVVHQETVALPSSALDSSCDPTLQKVELGSQDLKEKKNAELSDDALDKGAGNPSISARSNVESFIVGSESANAACAEATCGSPTVISCSEPYQQDAGVGINALPDHFVKSDDPKSPAATADNVENLQADSSGKVKFAVESSRKETGASEEDRSFSFEVGTLANLSEKNREPGWKPFPCRFPENNVVSIETPPGTVTKNANEEKSKKTSRRTSKKTNSSRRAAKELASEKQMTLIDSSPCVNSTTAGNTHLEEMQQCRTPESNALARQPFTDVQHLQLRAQIFVYGALIQGIPPIEAYMVSAFGDSDGARAAWQAVWRVAVERFQSQKSPLSTSETPNSSRYGSWPAEQATKDNTAKNSPASRAGAKILPSARSALPLHSPTVDMSSLGSSAANMPRATHLDFSQVVSPVYSYHSPQMRQPTPWFTQSPRPSPWLVSPPQSLIFDSSAQWPAVPTTETVKAAPSRSVTVSHTPSVPVVSPGTLPPNLAHQTTTSALVVQEEKQKPAASTPKSGSTSHKPRKRKKGLASVEQEPVTTVTQLQAEIASDSVVTKHSTVASGFTSSKSSPNNLGFTGLIPSTSQIVSVSNHLMTGGRGAEQGAIFSEEFHTRIEQSKIQADDAAAHATAAVGHSQGIWSQLTANTKIGLPSEVEEKLASAAAAAAAAASVAKAAAEAAKVAAEAALQAKMMADEALNSAKLVNSLQEPETGQFGVPSNGMNPLGQSPVSISKGKDKRHGSSTITSAAREVTKKRVEAASAAAKRAENLDSILKAAELAAEAVFQAGAILAMGDPLPFTLSELLEAGPECYWKPRYLRIEKPAETDNLQMMLASGADVAHDFDRSGKKADGQTGCSKEDKLTKEVTCTDKQVLLLEGTQSGNEVDEPLAAPLNITKNHPAPRSTTENPVQKGSLVEVATGNGKGIWFPATVLDVRDNSVHVSYSDPLVDEGNGHHKEWITLEHDGDNAPRIRIAHPVTAAKFEGTRKRRRDITGNYSWAIGDHVDAWTKDSWREGTIAEKCQGDETKFILNFPAEGDSMVVNSWNLRPSLVWKDGRWIEWSHVRDRKTQQYKGDSPYEKRQKRGLHETDADRGIAGAGASSVNRNIDNPKRPEDSSSLDLSENDMVFNVGKSVVEGNKADSLGFKRTGLQKEGSRVIFGVPRPGKKRKFMEVSKHFVGDKVDKVPEVDDSVKLAKYVMPQAQRPRESLSKIDTKVKRTSEMKSRGLKSMKPQETTVTNEKESLSRTVPSSDGVRSGFGFMQSMRASSNNEDSSRGKNNPLNVSTRSEDAYLAESGVRSVAGVPTSKKNSSTIVDRAKRRLPPAMGNSRRIEPRTSDIHENTNVDAAEPRRSNRRILPTSRLLEGLQSSLVVAKVPGEKGSRGYHRSASSRGRAHG